MKRVKGLFASASVVLILASPAAAVTARVSSSKLLQVVPGNIASTAFKVTNPDAPQDFIENIQMPSGWKLIMPANNLFAMPNNTSISRILAILVPGSTPSGTYTVTYEVFSRTSPSLRDRDEAKIYVKAHSKIEMIAVGPPKEVLNGSEFNVDVRIVNRGNSAENVKLLTESSAFYDTSVSPKTLSVEPLSAAYATITVKTNGIAKNSFEHNLNIKATDADDPLKQCFDEKDINTLITQNNSQTFDRFIRFPISTKVVETGDTSRSAMAIEMSGNAYINEEGTNKLDILYRTPDVSQFSSFGLRDEYHVNFDSPALKLKAGDNSYDLTYLTDMSYYARGIYAKASSGIFDAAIFTGQTRFESAPRTEDALQLNLRPAVGYNLGLQALRKNETSSKIYTILGGYKKSISEYINLELGMTENGPSQPGKDSAYRIEWFGRFQDSGIRYMLENLYAGPNYKGYYSDQYFTSASLILPAGGADWTFSARKLNTNLSLDAAKGEANDELYMSAGCLAPFAYGTRLLIAAEDYKNADRTPAASFDHSQKTYKIGIEKEYDRFSIQANTGLINYTDNLSGGSRNDRMQYSLYSAYSPDQNLSFTLYGIYNNGIMSATREGSVNLGGTISIKRGGFLEINLGYDYADSPSYRGSHTATLMSNLTLPNSNVFSLGGRWQKSASSGNDLYFLATYSLTFDIPVGIRSDLGSLSGRLVDESSSVRRPVAGVKIFAGGYAAVTDKDGYYCFPYLKEGSYPMWVDGSSIEEGKVTSTKLPLISISKNTESTVDIALVNSCSLAGIFKPGTAEKKAKAGRNDVFLSGDKSIDPASAKLIPDADLAKLPVILTNGDEKIVTLTDENGRFEVRGLRPGNWLATYDPEALPSNYMIEEGTNAAMLSQNESKQLEVAILPEIRRVRIIDSGSVGPCAYEGTVPKQTAALSHISGKTERSASIIGPSDNSLQSKILLNTVLATVNIVKSFVPDLKETGTGKKYPENTVASAHPKMPRYKALKQSESRSAKAHPDKGMSFFGNIQRSLIASTDLLRRSLPKPSVKVSSARSTMPE